MSKEADQILELYNKQVLSVKLVNKIKDHIANEMKEYKEYLNSDIKTVFKMLCLRAETNMLKVY